MTAVPIEPQTESNMKISNTPTLSTSDLPVPPLAKVSGDRGTTPGEFPYHVGLYSPHNAGMICGGAILSAYLILTAANCVQGTNPRDFRVIAGEHNRKKRVGSEQARLIKEFYMHENFTMSSFNNDIALIVLSNPLIFSDKVKSISLPWPNEEFTGIVEIMGFVYPTDRGSGLFGVEGADPNDLLLKSQLPIIPYEECAAKYSGIAESVTRGMFCVGSPGSDSRTMYSGGSTLCKRTNEKEPILCGIGSWGESGISADFPRVNTKVSRYIDWIQNADKVLADRRKCRTHEFFCSGSCIPRDKICDGNVDCYGGLDEIGCHNWNIIQCEPDQLRCDNGKCLKRKFFCDGGNDCQDNSDETKCPTPDWTCKETEVKCGHTGRCIPQEWNCDGRFDCDDLSDENETCAHFNSIAVQSQYENITVKPTQADSTWTGSCPTDKFYCAHPLYRDFCAPLRYRCDGHIDCLGGADEADCSLNSAPVAEEGSCSSNKFYCPHPLRRDKCVPLSWRCNGVFDCLGGTDEAHCSSTSAPGTEGSCPAHKFYCPSYRLPDNCALQSWLCDGDIDCLDGRDEANCNYSVPNYLNEPTFPVGRRPPEYPCEDDQFFCPLDYPSLASGEISFRRLCIPLRFRCDGTKHCIGGFDEQDCNDDEADGDGPIPTSSSIDCTSEKFMCADGSFCFPKLCKCDGERDCPDGSDEASCSTAVVSNNVPAKNVSTGDSFMTNTPCPPERFECPILGTLRECVPLGWKCDGHSDCPVGVDELHCPSVSTTPETSREGQVVFN